jgi:rhodanese-related sulfurtransferase
VIVYPAHGPGSACGKNIGKETFSTIGEQRKFNYALQPMSKEEFIKKVTDGILPPPQYFFEDARINKEGYDPLEHVIARNTKALSISAFKDAVATGATILDTRKADDFEKGFVPGAINIGLNGQFAVWVGTLVDISKPLVLVTDEGAEEETVLRLARVGYENVIGYLKDGVGGWDSSLSTIRSISAEDMSAEMKKGSVVVDVRKQGEWNTAHIKHATFLPLADFPAITEPMDRDQPYLVHCGGGYRSMTAISIMTKQGFKNLTNIYGGFGAMQQAGLEVETDQVLAS